MAANKLSKEQKAQIIEMLAAREMYSDIAAAVGCSVPTIKYYADKFGDQVASAQEEYDAQFINRGLRSWQKRVERLERLARRIEESLEEPEAELTEDDKADAEEDTPPERKKGKPQRFGLWVNDVKVSGEQRVWVKVFAGEAIRQYRAILDDIAKETGGRVATTKQEISGPKGQAVKVELDDVSRLTPEERAVELVALFDAARTRADAPAPEGATGE